LNGVNPTSLSLKSGTTTALWLFRLLRFTVHDPRFAEPGLNPKHVV
jgi:hypothetical protein